MPRTFTSNKSRQGTMSLPNPVASARRLGDKALRVAARNEDDQYQNLVRAMFAPKNGRSWK